MLLAIVALLALIFIPALFSLAGRALAGQMHWSQASHESTGQAPLPEQTPEAVVQVYAARTWGLRGAVAVHTWIATKRPRAEHYMRREVIGWRLRRGAPALVEAPGVADALWFSNPPHLLAELRGAQAEAAIDKIEAASAAYPYARRYAIWPGPNSNTYTAFVARRVPELNLHLPATAIGKDFLGDGRWLGAPPSGSGWQLSAGGYAGLTLALREGIEINLFGAALGLSALPPAVNLPGVGIWPPRNAAADEANGADKAPSGG